MCVCHVLFLLKARWAHACICASWFRRAGRTSPHAGPASSSACSPHEHHANINSQPKQHATLMSHLHLPKLQSKKPKGWRNLPHNSSGDTLFAQWRRTMPVAMAKCSDNSQGSQSPPRNCHYACVCSEAVDASQCQRSL